MAGTSQEPDVVVRASTRRASIGANVAVQIALAAAILGMLNYLGMRHYRRFDWTRDRVYTLSEQTESVLRALPRQVDLIVMMSQGDEMFRRVQEMLERYRSVAGSNLSVRYVDPDRDRAEFERMLEQYPIQGAMTEEGQIVVEQTIIVVAGERRQFINPTDDFVRFDPEAFMSSGGTFNPPAAETALTSAIYGVTEGRARVVCATSGHGEWEVSASGPGGPRDRSLGHLRDFLEHYEIELRSVSLGMGETADLAECTAVVVAGPRQPFLPEEARQLERFVEERGGDLVLLLDPIVRNERFAPTGLEDLARRFGVELHDDEVANGGPTAQFCGGGHATSFVARGGGERPVCVVRSRSLSVVEGREGREFLQTASDRAFGEVSASQLGDPQRDDSDRPGPLTLAVMVEQANAEARTARIEAGRDEREQALTEAERRGSRVIVAGDSDLFGPQLMQNAVLGNFEVAVGMLLSVAGSEVLVAVPPRDVERAQLTLTEDQLRSALLVLVLALPGLAAGAGVSLWWSRRR